VEENLLLEDLHGSWDSCCGSYALKVMLGRDTGDKTNTYAES
jgi:hypothetical protein